MELTQEERVLGYFARASKIRGFCASEQDPLRLSIRSGAKHFKRKALGLCGFETIKTLDEMVKLLIEVGMASSHDEGVEIAPQLVGACIEYSGSAEYSSGNMLGIGEVTDINGNKTYSIAAYYWLEEQIPFERKI